MKISRPFSGLLSALGTGYITAVLCGVCGIREWGALFVTVAVGGLTGAGVVLADDDAEVRGPISGLRKRANPTPPLASAFRDEVPKLPDINEDPLAVEINEAARRAGLIFTQAEISKIPGWAKRGRIVEYSVEGVSIVEPPRPRILTIQERLSLLEDSVRKTIINKEENDSIVEPPHGHPETRPERRFPKERTQDNDLESPL